MVCQSVPSADRVRFCSSGSEATLHLLRACRAFTGRDKIIRIEGHFHGYHELIYIGGHPPADEIGRNQAEPYIESPGIPHEFARLIVPIPHNDIDALERAINRYGDETAAVIMEPINYNQGCIVADRDYMELVRRQASAHNIALIYDETLSAFRTGPDCAQGYYGVKLVKSIQ